MKKLIGFLTSASAVFVTASYSAISAFAEDAAGSADGTAAAAGGSAFFSLVLPLIIMFGLLYFVAIRPQKKHDEEMKQMQSNLQIGDEVVTTAGIVGIIVNIGDDTVVIETGGARTKIRFKTWAINENVSAGERMKDAKTAAAAKKTDNTALATAAVVDDDAEDEKKSKKKKDKDKE